MSAKSVLADIGAKMMDVLREVHQMTVRVEGIDKEVHRMLEDFKQRLERAEDANRAREKQVNDLEARANDYVRRLERTEELNRNLEASLQTLKAVVEATYRNAVLSSVEEIARKLPNHPSAQASTETSVAVLESKVLPPTR